MIQNIRLVGTSHISKNSITEIKKQFLDFKPDIIAVELDKGRLNSLQKPIKNPKINPIKAIKAFGFSGFLFAYIGKIVQKKLGSIVKINPGSDMLMAVNLAKNNNIQLELIDQNINITLKKFSKRFTFKEKIKLIKEILISPFSKKKKMKIDLKKVPEEELIQKLIGEVKNKFPSIHSALIEDRNVFMAKKLVKLIKKEPHKKILAVVGAGHKKDMIQLIQKYNLLIESI